MHEVFNDMECEALADTFIARRERDSVAPPPLAMNCRESTGQNQYMTGTVGVHADFLRLRAAASAIWNEFLIFWWDARLCHHEFRFNFLAALRKRTKFRGRGATNYLKKTE